MDNLSPATKTCLGLLYQCIDALSTPLVFPGSPLANSLARTSWLLRMANMRDWHRGEGHGGRLHRPFSPLGAGTKHAPDRIKELLRIILSGYPIDYPTLLAGLQTAHLVEVLGFYWSGYKKRLLNA